MTGRPCPTCGLTRSFVAISRLDLPAAASVNPAGLFAYPIFLFSGLLILFRREEALSRFLGATWPYLAGVLLGIWILGLLGLRGY